MVLQQKKNKPMKYLILLVSLGLAAFFAATPTEHKPTPQKVATSCAPLGYEIEYLPVSEHMSVKRQYCLNGESINAYQYEMGVVGVETPIIDFFRLTDYKAEMLDAVGEWAIFARSYAYNYQNRNGCLKVSARSCQAYKANWQKDLSDYQLRQLRQAYDETKNWILWDPLLNGPAQASYADETCDEDGRRILSPMGRDGGFRSASMPFGALEKDPMYVNNPAGSYRRAKTGASQVGYLQAITRKEVDYRSGGGYRISEKSLDKSDSWEGWSRIERIAWYYPHFYLVTDEGVIDLAPIAQYLAQSCVSDVPLLDTATLVVGSQLAGVSVNNGFHPEYSSYDQVVGKPIKIDHGISVKPRYRGVGAEVALRFQIVEPGTYQVSLNSIRRQRQKGSYNLAAYVYGADGSGFSQDAQAVVCDGGFQKENRPTAKEFHFPVGEYLLVVDVGPTDATPGIIPPFRWSIQKK